jgi:hypothetical protein
MVKIKAMIHQATRVCEWGHKGEMHLCARLIIGAIARAIASITFGSDWECLCVCVMRVHYMALGPHKAHTLQGVGVFGASSCALALCGRCELISCSRNHRGSTFFYTTESE